MVDHGVFELSAPSTEDLRSHFSDTALLAHAVDVMGSIEEDHAIDLYDDGTAIEKSARTDSERRRIESNGLAEGNEGSPVLGRTQTWETLEKFIVKPPYDPGHLANVATLNTRLLRSIHAYARNTVGLGWAIVPPDPDEKFENDAEGRAQFEEQSRRAKRLLRRPNSSLPFSSVMYRVIIDRESQGQGYLEGVRDLETLEQRYLNHVPGHTIRRKRRVRIEGRFSEPGYLQLREGQVVHFKEWGDLRLISAKTGIYYADENEFFRRTLDEEDDEYLAEPATELQPFLIYSPRSMWYGVPRWVPAIPAVVGNRFAAVRNCSFFENDALPRFFIIVRGGRLGPKQVEKIERFVQFSGKGPENHGRGIVIQADQLSPGPEAASKTEVEIKFLNAGLTEEAGFRLYRKQNDDEIRESFGLGLIFYGTTEDVNRASAQETRRVANEQEFDPERDEIAYVLTNTLLCGPPVLPFENFESDDPEGGAPIRTAPEELDVDPDKLKIRLEFLGPKTIDEEAQARSEESLSRAAAVTPNDTRVRIGLPPYPDTPEYAWAKIPVPVFRQQVEREIRLGEQQLRLKSWFAEDFPDSEATPEPTLPTP